MNQVFKTAAAAEAFAAEVAYNVAADERTVIVPNATGDRFIVQQFAGDAFLFTY